MRLIENNLLVSPSLLSALKISVFFIYISYIVKSTRILMMNIVKQMIAITAAHPKAKADENSYNRV